MEEGTDEQQRRVLRHIAHFALGVPQLEHCRGLLDRFPPVYDSPLALVARWAIVLRLHSLPALSPAERREHVESAAAGDPTELKRRAALKTAAFESRGAEREAIWARVSRVGRPGSFVDLRDELDGLFHPLLPADATRPLLDRAFDALEALALSDSARNVRTFLEGLVVPPTQLGRARTALAAILARAPLEEYPRTLLLKELDELERRERAVAMYAKSS